MIRLSTLLFFLFGWLYVQVAQSPVTGYSFTPSAPLLTEIVVFGVSAVLVLLDLLRKPSPAGRLILVSVGISLVILPQIVFNIEAHRRVPYANLHDGGVMTEAALRFLADGKNPYAEDYGETPFGIFPEPADPQRENAARHSYVYLPGYLLVSYPFFRVSETLLGWYDQRFSHLAFFLLAASALVFLARDQERRLLALIGFALNPLFLQGFVAGFNDVQTYGFLALTFLLLAQGRKRWAAVALGFALATKQQSWFLAPFFLAFLYADAPVGGSARGRWRATLRDAWPAAVVAGALLIPFLLWSSQALIDDTIRYPAGTLAENFPIRGFGLSVSLVSAGFIRSIWDTYPFWIWQAAAGAPLLVLLLIRQLRENSLQRLAASYALLLFVFWFFSRFFFENYLAYLSLVLLVAFIAPQGNRVPVRAAPRVAALPQDGGSV